MVGTALLIALMIAIVIGAVSLIRFLVLETRVVRSRGPAARHIPPPRPPEGGGQANFPRIKFVAGKENTYEYVGYMGL